MSIYINIYMYIYTYIYLSVSVNVFLWLVELDGGLAKLLAADLALDGRRPAHMDHNESVEILSGEQNH